MADVVESIGKGADVKDRRNPPPLPAAEKPRAASATKLAPTEDAKLTSTKAAKLKSFAAGEHETAPKTLQKGKKGGTYYVSSGGRKVYTKG